MNSYQDSEQAALDQTQNMMNNLKAQADNGSSVMSGIDSLNQNAATTPTVSNDNSNWFTKLLPTIGSFAGMAAPIALGALGAPATGGLSLLAGLGLAGAGGGLGKLAENALEGKQDLSKDVGTSALESAGGQLLGTGIGKAVGAVGGAVGRVASKGLAEEATSKAAQEAVNAAQTTRNVWGGIKSSLLRKNDLTAAQQLAEKIGIDKNMPEQFLQSGKAANNILGTQLDEALGRSGTTNTTKMLDTIKGAINENSGTIGSFDAIAKSAGRMGLPNTPAAKMLNQLQDLTAGISNRADADPLQVRDVISKIGAMAADAKPGISATTGVVDPEQKAVYNTLSTVYNKLKASLYNTPAVAKEVEKLTGNIQAGDVGGNQLLASHINDALNNSKSAQDLLDHLGSFTKMTNLGSAGVDLAKNPATAAALNAAKQALPIEEQGLGSEISSAIANKNPIATATGKALSLGRKGGVAGTAALGLSNLLQRIAPTAGTITGQTIANSPNYVAPAGAGAALNMQPQGIGSTGNALGDILNSNSTTALPLQELLTLQEHGGGYNVPTEMSQWATPAATSLKQMTAASSAQKQLQALMALYNSAGGAQGTIGGLLSQLGGAVTGGPAGQYGAQAQQLAQQISGLTGTQISAPSLTMTPETAQGVLAQMQAALSAYGG
jgi:hypothetical protein